MSKTIMLIHGAWLNSKSWEGFKARYEAQGYTVVTPDWPYDDRDPADLRASPDPRLARLSQREILDHLEAVIRTLPEEPILIGHSLGGVFVQHLLDRGLGVAGVAIDPAPTSGVPLGPHAIRSALPVFIDPFSGRKAKVMSRSYFKTRFAQTAPKDEADNRPGATLSEGIRDSFWLQGMMGGIKGQLDCIREFSEVDYSDDLRRIDVPTLIIHGDDDQIVPIVASALKSSRIVADATLKIYTGGDHGLPTTQQDRFNADVLAFLEGEGGRTETGDRELARA